MKTLSKGVNIDFPLGQVANKIILFSCFFISTISSQTYLHNFVITENIKTYKGYDQFRLLDFDKDGIDDLFLFGNQEKNFVLHKGNKNSTFDEPIRKFFFYPIDDIQWFTKGENGDDYYLFVSRKKRLVGLVSFTKNYAFRLLNTIEFNSYPSSINVTDIDEDGINEAFVFGSNFIGITRINNNGYRLTSEIISDQSVFSNLLIKDFNQDEVQDIIAVDVLNNSLSFIENTEINGFTTGREIAINEELFSVDEFDYNQDSFNDLIISKTYGLEIIEGDSVNSYSNSSKIPFDYNPHKYIFADLNKDSITDIIVMDKENDQAIFYSDYSELKKYFSFGLKGITDLHLLNQNDENHLVLLSKLGKIKIISNSQKWKDDFSVSVISDLENVKFAEKKDSGFSYILYSDEANNSVNILQLDTTGNFVEQTTNQFQNAFTDYNYSNDFEHIVTSTKGSRLLEIINLSSNELVQNYLYTKHSVDQILFDSSNSLDILELDEENLFLETIVKSEKSFNSLKIISIDSNVVSSLLVEDNLIYYWKNNETDLTLYSYKDSLRNVLLSITDTMIMKSRPVFVTNDKKTISILSNGNKSEVYQIGVDNILKYNFEVDTDLSQIKDNQSKLYDLNNKKNVLYVNDKIKNKLLRYNYFDESKTVVLNNSIDGIEINDYFVRNLFGVNYLVYSDKNNSCLTFKVLD